MSVKPYLLNHNSGYVDLDNLGGGMDYRQRVSEIYGNDFFPDDESVVLILTRVHDQEADVMGLELAENGINYIRLNVDDIQDDLTITHSVNNGELSTYLEGPGFNSLNTQQVKLVWFRRFYDLEVLEPYPDNITDKYFKKEWKYFLDALIHHLDCAWINHPDSVRRTNKIEQMKVAKKVNFLMPETIVSNNKSHITDFLEKYVKNSGVIVKAMESHYIEDNRKLHNVFGKVAYDINDLNVEELTLVPTIIQELINFSKEARVTVVGQKVIGSVLQKTSNEGDWHHDDIREINMAELEVPKNIKEKCVEFLRESNLDYGAFDFMITPENDWFFLEVNPLGDWRWVELHTGQQITNEILNYFIEKLYLKEGSYD